MSVNRPTRFWYSSGSIWLMGARRLRRPRLFHEALGELRAGKGVLAITVRTHVVGELLRDRRAADHDLHIVPEARIDEGLDNAPHIGHRRRQERRHAEQGRAVLLDRLDEGVV